MKDAKIVMGGFGVLLVLLLIRPLLDVVVYGIFLYYISRPLYSGLSSRIRFPTLSALATLLLMVLPIILVFLYAFSVASYESMNFLTSIDSSLRTTIENTIDNFSSIAFQFKLSEIIHILGEQDNLVRLWNVFSSVVMQAFGLVFKTFLMLAITFYLLVDGPKIRAWAERKILRREPGYMALLEGVDSDLRGIFFGSILTAFFITLIAVVWFSFLNVFAPPGLTIPYTMLLSVLCGLTSLIPGVGVALIWVPTTVYLVIQASLKHLISQKTWFIVAFLVGTASLVDYLPNLFLRPALSSKRIHPGLLLMSYIFGPIAFGMMGLFLGPIILVLAVNIFQHLGEEKPPVRNRRR